MDTRELDSSQDASKVKNTRHQTHQVNSMRVTKLYLFILQFDPGNTEACDKSRESLRQAVWRAHLIPEHRIFIETHEDPSDLRDIAMAARRLQALRQHFLYESVDEGRLEGRTHEQDCYCKQSPDEWSRRAEINLFPRAVSRCPDVGEPLLSLEGGDFRNCA